MKRSTRNRLFEEKRPLIHQVMNKRSSLIEAYGLCREDVRQNLALEMLRALDAYDLRLDQKLLRMLPPSKRYGVPYAPRKKGFRVDSLDAMGLAKAVPVKARRRKRPFQTIRRLRCWLAGKEAVPCAKSAV